MILSWRYYINSNKYETENKTKKKPQQQNEYETNASLKKLAFSFSEGTIPKHFFYEVVLSIPQSYTHS